MNGLNIERESGRVGMGGTEGGRGDTYLHAIPTVYSTVYSNKMYNTHFQTKSVRKLNP